jgi:hypothetical protein
VIPTIAASATGFIRREMATGTGAATVLGAFPTALYLELSTGSVLAVLTADAVALPLGLVLPTTSARTPLDRHRGPAAVDAGSVSIGDLRVRPASDRPSRVVFAGVPLAARVAEARATLAAAAPGTGFDARGASHAAAISLTRAAGELLGSGPGLTPAGDDFLCGLLAGGFAFGRSHAELRAAIASTLADRPRATTSLSRQLLRLACDGHAIEAVIGFGRALCSPDPRAVTGAAERLSAIGHSSGVALGDGVLAAADAS